MVLALFYTLTVITVIKAEPIQLVEPPKPGTLHYDTTLNKSMSKFQRINHIEQYLVHVKDTVHDLDEKAQTGVKSDIKVMKASIALLEKKMEMMSKDIDELKKILKPSKTTKE